MNSLFVISEIGECKEFSSNDQLSKLYNAYLSQMGITNEDTYLITEKGEIITMESLSNNNTGFVFAYCNKNHYESFQQLLIDDIITKRSSISITSASNLLSEEILNKKCQSDIESLINELLPHESLYDSIIPHSSIEAFYNQIVNTYVTYCKISTSLSSSINQIKKIKENVSYMQRSKKILVTYFNSIIPQLSSLKKSMEKKEKEINERIRKSDMSYRKYLEIKGKEYNLLSLQDFEIFKANDNKKKLIDIKSTFVKKFLYIQSKIKEKNKLLTQHIDKISLENVTTETQTNHKDIAVINGLYLQLNDAKACYKKHKIFDDLMLFQCKCQSVANDLKSNNQSIALSSKSISCLNDIKAIKSLYENLYPLPLLFHQAEDKVNQFKEVLKRMIKTNSQFIVSILDSIKVLLTLQTKYKSYEQFLSLIETDINEFEIITKGAQHYNEYCDEILTRVSFNKRINQSIKQLTDQVANENERRKRFNAKNGEAMEKMFNVNNKKEALNGDLRLVIDYVNNSQLDQYYYHQFRYERKESLHKEEQADQSNEDSSIAQRMTRDKDNQIKQLTMRLKKKEEQVLNYQTEINKISKTIESLSEGFNTQIKELEEQVNEKDKQINNLSKIINENTFGSFFNCPMCQDAGMNSLDYQMWSGFMKELNTKLNKKTEDYSNLQTKYCETLNNLFIIKRTFFNHLNQVISEKNEKLLREREYYENVILHLEDLLSNH